MQNQAPPPTPERSCLTCSLAEWQRTAVGRLHPNGQGFCRFPFPAEPPPIPKAFYYLSRPSRGGGSIERKEPHTDCPTWRAQAPEAPPPKRVECDYERACPTRDVCDAAGACCG